MARKPRKDDGPVRRSETVSVRLDPRLKYLAELAARKQRRTLSGYIEWAVEQSLNSVDLTQGMEPLTVADAERALRLWDVEEADRVANLALHFPELLTFEEQLIWRLVKANGALWNGRFAQGEYVWHVKAGTLKTDKLREHWDTFKKVAANQLPSSALPTWEKSKPYDPEEIPF